MSLPPICRTNNPDWTRVAVAFSNADLRAHPNTDEVMSFFSDNATFYEARYYNVGKTIAWYGFKILCEWSTLAFKREPSVMLEEKKDHIVWKFTSTQLRSGRLPAWISPPAWYHITGEYKLYFEGSGANTKISRIVTITNEWTPETIPK